VIGDGIDWGVGETAGFDVDDAIAIGVAVGSDGSPGGVAVEVPLAHDVTSKTIRSKKFILRKYVFISFWTISDWGLFH